MSCLALSLSRLVHLLGGSHLSSAPRCPGTCAQAADAIVRWRAERLPLPFRDQLLGDRLLPPLPRAALAHDDSPRSSSPRAATPRSPKRLVVPPMSSAQVKLALDAWTLRGDAVNEVLKVLSDEDECCVCMSSLSGISNSPYPACRTCSRTAVCTAASTGGTLGASAAAEPTIPRPPLVQLPCGHLTGAKPHCMHAHCAERWLLRKASCPVCRRDVRPLLPKVPAPPQMPASRPPSPRALVATSTFGSETSRSASPRNSRPGSARADRPAGSSPRSKRPGATTITTQSRETISMRELAAKLPPNRAVGVGGKLWVGWRHVY